MTNDLVKYNGYQFNEYSTITVNATMQDDDSGRTTLYHRYKLRVESTIYAETGDNAGEAGLHFRRVREDLTKKGQHLIIYHKGFDAGQLEINAGLTGPRDATFGPHPRVIDWEPIGHENAVHIVWECEFCISACHRHTGIMSLNYSISTQIDTAGYTKRTISGYIEIAMTRLLRGIPDTADAYRDQIIIGRLQNFEREHSWNLSLDKRRADFTITDTEIKSPNAYPAGIIRIQGNHSVGWSRRQSANLHQNIRASIELARNQPRSRAWEIFKSIVESRLKFVGSGFVFIENLHADESLFDNTFQFSVGYRLYVQPDLSILNMLTSVFGSVGLGEALNVGSWAAWSQSVQALQSHRGFAQLEHDPKQDQIIDLCSDQFMPEQVADSPRQDYAPPRRNDPLVNKKPPPKKSYIRYETWVDTIEDVPTTIQINVDPDDLIGEEFNPNNPEATLGKTASGSQVARFVESQAGRIEFIWRGYAERVGYPIPRTNKLKIGGLTLTRVGRGYFKCSRIGNQLGQPVYAAAWNQRYVVTGRPAKLDGLNDWDGK